MFSLESWIVIFVFLINLIFMLVMSFVSPYYKALTSEGLGKIFNIAWIIVVIIVAGVIFTFNAGCLVSGHCEVLSWVIVGLLIAMSIGNISWGVYNTVKYKKNGSVTQESKKTK